MRTIVFTNDKGGVTKTTTVASLGVKLSQSGYRVLIVDMDSQGDVTFTILGVRPPLIEKTGSNRMPATTYTLMIEKHTLQQVAMEAPRYPNLFIIPSNDDLGGAVGYLVNQPGAQTILYQILKGLSSDAYDFVLIDTGKGFDVTVINAIAAADDVIIMTTPGRLELDAVQRMYHRVDKVRKRTLLGADHPKVVGIIMADANRYSVAQDTQDQIEKLYPGLLFDTVIPRSDEMKKAIARAQSIFEFNPSSKVALAYESLAKEVINHVFQPA